MQTVPRLGPRARLGAPSNTMPVSASGGAWRPPTGFRLWMHLYQYVRSVCRRAQGLTRVPCPPLCAHKNTFAPFAVSTQFGDAEHTKQTQQHMVITCFWYRHGWSCNLFVSEGHF
jgi:hypothetical protein